MNDKAMSLTRPSRLNRRQAGSYRGMWCAENMNKMEYEDE